MDSTVTSINDLLKKGFVVHIWTTKENLIGYKVSIDDERDTIIHSSSPNQIFVKEMLLDMIKNGTRKDKGCVNFLIYVDRMGKYSIIDNNRQ